MRRILGPVCLHLDDFIMEIWYIDKDQFKILMV